MYLFSYPKKQSLTIAYGFGKERLLAVSMVGRPSAALIVTTKLGSSKHSPNWIHPNSQRTLLWVWDSCLLKAMSAETVVIAEDVCKVPPPPPAPLPELNEFLGDTRHGRVGSFRLPASLPVMTDYNNLRTVSAIWYHEVSYLLPIFMVLILWNLWQAGGCFMIHTLLVSNQLIL